MVVMAVLRSVVGLLVASSCARAWSTSPPRLSPTPVPNEEKVASEVSSSNRRSLVLGGLVAVGTAVPVLPARADEAPVVASSGEILIQVSGDVKRFFNEARALELQGNMAAAQRLYTRVTQIEPRFVYGWSQLGNTQTVFGDLNTALQSYTTAIDLCVEYNNRQVDSNSGGRMCNDLYVMLLNRGTIRLNTGEPGLALEDLTRSNALRARPDAVVLQNLARAKELNGQYTAADRDYTTAIMMTSNEVSPFWLRSAMVKYQMGDLKSAMDLLKRVEIKFPEAPEVRAAYAVLLSAQGDRVAGQQKYLEIPDRARSKYVDEAYLTKTISWPPAMREGLASIATAVGDVRK